jgi:hypothetical protein
MGWMLTAGKIPIWQTETYMRKILVQGIEQPRLAVNEAGKKHNNILLLKTEHLTGP